MANDFETKLDRYAELAVKLWLNVQPEQRLVLLAPLETTQLARLIAKHAYQNRSPFVTMLWDDGESTRIRYQYASRDSFAEYSPGLVESIKVAVERGDALLSIMAQDPDLLKGLDQEFIAQAAKSAAERTQDYSIRIARNDINWLGMGMAVPSWAARVFPDAAPEEQVDKLWDAIFSVCRMHEADPVAAWQKHIAELDARRHYLTAKAYETLHYTGPGTDLHVALLRGHQWIGGGETTSTTGIRFMPNIPTEEIFTAPHKLGTHGHVTTIKPLAVRGVVIDKFTLTFDKGSVVKVEASNDQEVLETILGTDEGARRLGEVALVPHSSPISQSGLIFFNTLFDENAASHLALGRAYPNNLQGSAKMSPEELSERGVNDSLMHVDFMIGSDEINIDGFTTAGQSEPVMRCGEWAFGV